MVRVTSAAALCAALLCGAALVGVHANTALPTCCHDMDGVAYSDCTCLIEDRTYSNLTVPEGGYKRFHWVMSDWTVINVADELRPEMTVEIAPCSGDAHLLVQGPSLQSDPFPTLESNLWNASASYSPNAITFSLTAAQYFITVFGNMTSTFSAVIQLTDDSHPTPGGNGTVVAVPSQTDDLLLEDDPISMDITFFTAETAHGNENMYTYRVFYVPIVPGQPCGEDNVTATPDCILTTMCGAQAVPGSMATDWLAFPTLLGENVSVTVPNLQQNQEYSFTVAVRAPTGNVQMYTGTRGTPTYDRVGQAQSDGTILAVAGGAAGLFVLLVACIFIAKKRLDRAFQQRRLARQYKNIAPTAEAADAEAKATLNPAAGAGRST